MLREELQHLQEQCSYVGEVVKPMDKKKVLVKVHPEGIEGYVICTFSKNDIMPRPLLLFSPQIIHYYNIIIFHYSFFSFTPFSPLFPLFPLFGPFLPFFFIYAIFSCHYTPDLKVYETFKLYIGSKYENSVSDPDPVGSVSFGRIRIHFRKCWSGSGL